MVRSVIAVDVKLQENRHSGAREEKLLELNDEREASQRTRLTEEHRQGTAQEIDLSYLTVEQQRIVREMLHDEMDAFAADENDIGCIYTRFENGDQSDRQATHPKKTILPFLAHTTRRSSTISRIYSTRTLSGNPDHPIPVVLSA